MPKINATANPRRLRLSALLLLFTASALLACDRNETNPLATAPSFRIGKPEQYRAHGLYQQYVEQYQTLLVSRPASGSTMLVALDLHCPFDGRVVKYDDLIDRIHCDNCDSRWSTDGVIQSGSAATASLDRYRIRLAGAGPTEQRDLVVDTSRRYRQFYTKQVGSRTFEIQEWSATDSMYHFDTDPRHTNTLEGKIKVD